MFDSLCLSGGGTKGIAQLAALEFCNNQGLLKNISAYSGTSIGSIICVLLCCGYRPQEIYLQFSKIKLSVEPSEVGFMNIFREFGLVSSDYFCDELKNMIRKKVDILPTFQELYEVTGKELFICSVCLSNGGKVVYFNHKTHPSLGVVEAMRMSCNLPVLFTRIPHEGNLYIDGGFADHLPFSVFGEKANILAICTSGIAIDMKNFGGFVEYLFNIFMTPIQRLETFQIDSASRTPNLQLIDIDVGKTCILNLVLNDNIREDLWLKGYDSAKKWYKDNYWGDF